MEQLLSGIISIKLSLSGVLLLIDFLILLFFYYRLSKSKIGDNNFFLYFKRFTLCFALFSITMAIPVILFSKSSYILGVGYIVGHAFMYIASAYLARIWLLVSRPSFNSNIVFVFYLLLGAITTVLNVYLFNYPVINESGIAIWNDQQLVVIFEVVILMSTFLPAAIVFIGKSFKQPKQRKRLLLIGMSFLAIFLGGPLHDIAETVYFYLMADIITIIGLTLMFWGVMSSLRSSNINTRKIKK